VEVFLGLRNLGKNEEKKRAYYQTEAGKATAKRNRKYFRRTKIGEMSVK